MDKIIIKNLSIFCFHGVNSEEKTQGQRFLLDITCQCDLSKAAANDDINSTVSYAKIIKTVTKSVSNKSYNLLEKVAQVVIEQIFFNYKQIKNVVVCIKKPMAPINAQFDYVAVELTRSRSEFLLNNQ